MDVKEMLFTFLGGLGIFLFGIKYMSEGLQKTAGDRLRTILEKMTSNPLMGVLAGTLVTAIIQSSSGTTVLTVGLVNAGLLSLKQAIGIIMGANIGTTITSFIIGFKISKYALPIVAVGAILIFFSKKKSINYWGQVIFGFGLLFLGLKYMSAGMKPLRGSEVFLNLMETLADQPLLGVLVGTVFTMIVQSSSATIGVLQGLAESGGVTFDQALPILFGDNIGTTVTAALAAIGTSVMAKRAALTHVMFNIIGTLIFLPLLSLGIFPSIVKFIADGLNIKMQIAWAHGLFNVSNTIIQLPFIGLLAYIVTKLIPGEEETIEYGPKYLDSRFLSNPSVALGQAAKELLRMGVLAKEALTDSITYFFTGEEKKSQQSLQKEEVINDLDHKITEYLVKISQNSLSSNESNQSTLYLQIVNDIERIGDHAENIVELAQYSHEHKLPYSEEAKKELNDMINLTLETFQKALSSLENNDIELAKEVVKNERIIDQMEKDYRKGHLKRLNEGTCFGSSGVVFLDIISNLERIGDHSFNIAQAVLDQQ
ncbi:sodium-dependent phosphate transporter [Vulcanibacillus modesticaldus]|uniref:Sodium-dependent phosphate transporter n=1 Tax=Vulcanibacillus modesticaldus TaxID=337097 RepID=A0A1D2YSY3_9BACI|nr:Na/Pi cotransporter family protein [Vulcanibacillus modesticaldus]OEF98105.1 sodium-dependent phosphate transporter [Vulcanibacillus modesticaldus]